jgi:hypothetical protein
MEPTRKPLAKVEGRRRLPQSGLTIAWRGTPRLDDWVVYLANGTNSILAHNASERRVTDLLERLQTMTRTEIRRLASA